MAAAASIGEAIIAANLNLTLQEAANTFKTSLENFVASLGTILDEKSQAQRTVRNWQVLLSEQAANAPDDGSADFQQINVATMVLCRCLYATRVAEDDSRITTAQETAILAAYNTDIAL